MPDITMCRNEECPLKQRCYRYTAKPDMYWQSFAIFEFKMGKNGCRCDEFWDNKGYKK